MADPGDHAELPPPAFFLSYAHPLIGRQIGVPKQATRWLDEFFDDLSETVAELVGLETGTDAGFMDRSMESGEIWSDELLQAVGTCQVCVALLSPRYVARSRKWCGMEWSAFAKRQVIRRSDHREVSRRPIIPVNWAPMPDGRRFPAPVMKVQHFGLTGLPDPSHRVLYEAEGIRGLMHLGSPAYDTLVWKLARAVSTFCETYWVERMTFRQADLRNVFRRQVSARQEGGRP
jgi:hypothetical protein